MLLLEAAVLFHQPEPGPVVSTVLTLLGLNFSKVVLVIHVIRLRILSCLFRQMSEFSLFAGNWCGNSVLAKDDEIVF